MAKFVGNAVVAVVAMLIVAAFSAPRVSAESYPSRLVTIIVPLAAGTGMDSIVRIYAEELYSFGTIEMERGREGAWIGRIAIGNV
jgi:tripartite-type tricarboxylate transporter receptor subunit TctC